MGMEGSFTVSTLQFSVSMGNVRLRFVSPTSRKDREIWGTPFRWFMKIAPSVIEVRKAQRLKPRSFMGVYGPT